MVGASRGLEPHGDDGFHARAPMRKKAVALGEKIREEDGVAQAVRLIETHHEHPKG